MGTLVSVASDIGHRGHPQQQPLDIKKMDLEKRQGSVDESGLVMVAGAKQQDPFFSATWDEFDRDRNQIMSKSHDFWDKVDADMKQFEASVELMESDLEGRVGHLRPAVPDWAVPKQMRARWPGITGSTGSTTSLSDSTCLPAVKSRGAEDLLVKVEEGADSWDLELRLPRDTDRDTLRVAVRGDIVSVSGHSSSRVSGNVGESTSSVTEKSFTQKFTLPWGFDPDQLSSKLTSDGRLLVTCPRKYMRDVSGQRNSVMLH